MQLYKSYVFKDKDPIIDRLATIFKDEGVNNNQVSAASGVSSSTLHNWFLGDTMRPQFCTIMAVSRALGYDIQLVSAKDQHTVSITKRRFNGSARSSAARRRPGVTGDQLAAGTPPARSASSG
jgi:transcriptional regulator with XRE-family HTH domain